MVRRGRDSWRAGPGEGIILPHAWRRHQAFSPGSTIVSHGLRLTWPDGGTAVTQDAPVVIAAAAPLAGLARAVIALRGGPDDAAQALRRRAALASYAAAWLEALLAGGASLRPSGGRDAMLERLRAELARDPRLGAIDWRRLREVTGLSRPQLDRRCRSAWGTAVRGLRDALVLERVRELLAEPQRNLAGIAGMVGATDASHLVKWYRRCAGRTPGEERRRAGQA